MYVNSLESLRTSVERFVALDEEEWKQFSMNWIPFSFDKGETVTRIDQVEPYFYHVNKGLMRGYFDADGTEYNIGFSYDGDYSGIYDSFVTRKPSDWTLETLEPTYGLKIGYDQFEALFDLNPKFERWARKFYQSALIGLGLFIRGLLADTAEEKYRKLIARSPHVIQRIPQKHLASYLGMSPETYSRLRAKIRD